MLVGRDHECGILAELLDAARRGDSRVLVIGGEPGIGKTALLEFAVESARDFRVLHATGAESESQLAFAALHQVSTPIMGMAERLPAPQRDALNVAFGLTSGHAPDAFLIGLGVLGLLAEAS